MKIIKSGIPKTIRYYLLPAVIFFALIAANVYTYQQSPFINRPTEETAGVLPERIQASAIPANLISVDNVKDLAAKEVPDAPIEKVELRTKNNRAVFVVELANKVVLAFDAKTGEKLAQTLSETKEMVESVLPDANKTTVELDKPIETETSQPAENTPAEPTTPTTETPPAENSTTDSSDILVPLLPNLTSQLKDS